MFLLDKKNNSDPTWLLNLKSDLHHAPGKEFFVSLCIMFGTLFYFAPM
jgi:hypothetical protein